MINAKLQYIHRPLFWVVIFYAVGIGVGEFVSFGWIGLCLMGLLFLKLFIKNNFFRTFVLLMMFFGVGVMSIQSCRWVDEKDIRHVARFHRGKVMGIKGVIFSDVLEKDFFKGKKYVFTLKVQEVKSPWGWKKRKGKILVNMFQKQDVSYGDYIEIEGKLHRPYNFAQESNFSYADYLKNKGMNYILSVSRKSKVMVLDHHQGNRIKAESLNLRHYFKSILAKYLSYNEAGIMQAILLGDRSHIPKHIRDLFVRTGTAHILAISGLHVGVVAGLFLVFFNFMPIARPIKFLSVIILLMGYAFLTGGRPSVVRSVVMISILLGSLVFEKQTDGLNTLSLAALILLCFNPLNLFDIGFQLSFGCVFSIILLNPKMTSIIPFHPKNPIVKFFHQSAIVSLSVWLGSLGLVAYYFNIITPITILANLVIVPFIAIIVSMGFGLLLSANFITICVPFFVICLKAALNLMAGITFLFSLVPYAYIDVQVTSYWQVIIYYLCLLIVFFCPFWRRFRAGKELTSEPNYVTFSR